MANKRSSGGKSSKKLDSFNRTQEIYKLLEKGIIESEALLSTAADRPEDDAHVIDLLESTGAPVGSSYTRPARRPSGSSKRSGPKRTARKAGHARRAARKARPKHAGRAAKKRRRR